MAAKVQVQKSKSQAKREAVLRGEPVPAAQDAEELKAATDALLDEIDAVLDDVLGEETAQEFVAAYKQKGGQ